MLFILREIGMNMPYPRDVLNELRWREGLSLEEAIITYRHRGAPGDIRVISGKEIEALLRSFFRTAESTIPYHRIIKIEHRGSVLYKIREIE